MEKKILASRGKNRICALTLGLSLLLAVSWSQGQVTPTTPAPTTPTSATLDQAHRPKAKLEQTSDLQLPDSQGAASHALSARGLFTSGIEGPCVDTSGALYAVNFKSSGTIGRMDPGEAPFLWVTLPAGQVASALRMLNPQEMLVAERKQHQLLKIDIKTKSVSRLAQNKTMNQPNDMSISRDGTVFMSDPSWSSKKQGGLWCWDKLKGLRLLAQDLKAINGIGLSPDEKTIYFTESIQGGLWAFDWDGSKLSHKRLIRQFEADSVDGIRLNTQGEIFVARIRMGKIDRISATGSLISSTKTVGKDPTNLAFGGNDGKTIFVTQRDGRFIESFQTDLPGLEWQILQASIH